MQSSSDTVLAHEKLASVDDDEAEQEQQESGSFYELNLKGNDAQNK